MEKICIDCQNAFQIDEQDQQFLKNLTPVVNNETFPIPLPEQCWKCRLKLRLSFMNDSNLYYRNCDATGKQMITNYTPDKKYKIYNPTSWYSDEWNPLEYGQEINWNEPFFSQYERLFKKVPRLALSQGKSMENAEFNNHSDRLKDCYFNIQSIDSLNCCYNDLMIGSKDSFDNTFCIKNELCYETIYSKNNYNVSFAVASDNCRDSLFLKDCKGLSNCFMCANLEYKEYHIKNKPYTKEEYFKAKELLMKELNENETILKKEFDGYISDFKSKKHLENCEDCNGDFLQNSSNCRESYLGENNENVHYSYFATNQKDTMDCSGHRLEHSYFANICGDNSYNCYWSIACWENTRDIFYSDYIFTGSHDLFGCIGLKKKSFCILNKQYTEEEYKELVPKLIKHMQSTDEWGKFFPIGLSPFAYNETRAHDFFPLTEEEALKSGYFWKEEKNSEEQGTTTLIKPIETYSDEKKGKELLLSTLRSEVSGKPYKIIPQELAFHLKQNLPLPKREPRERMRDRFRKLINIT